MDMDREQQVIKADRRARMMLVVCVVVLFLIAALATSLIPRGQSHLQGREPIVTLHVLQGFTAFIFLSVLPISGYIFWFGRGVVRSRQVPPPGTWVIFDMRVIEGERAVRRGQALIALAILLAAVALFAGTWLPYKFGRAFAGSQRQSVGLTGQTDGNQPAANPAP